MECALDLLEPWGCPETRMIAASFVRRIGGGERREVGAGVHGWVGRRTPLVRRAGHER